jgi:hypothetical protein
MVERLFQSNSNQDKFILYTCDIPSYNTLEFLNLGKVYKKSKVLYIICDNTPKFYNNLLKNLKGKVNLRKIVISKPSYNIFQNLEYLYNYTLDQYIIIIQNFFHTKTRQDIFRTLLNLLIMCKLNNTVSVFILTEPEKKDLQKYYDIIHRHLEVHIKHMYISGNYIIDVNKKQDFKTNKG